MSEFREALCWFRLFLVKGLGSKKLHRIYKAATDSGVSMEQLCLLESEKLQTLLPRLGRVAFDLMKAEDGVEQDFQMLLEKGVKPVHVGHESYPQTLLRRLDDNAPPLLFCCGNLGLLDTEGVAIVGSRHASVKALDIAYRLAKHLAQSGKNVISGYAAGVDTQAHLGALHQDGTTTIVLSMGILGFSKRREFEDTGWENDFLVISQFHPSERWRARNAMIRNRLLCALSRAVVVVESGPEKDDSGKMSGSFAAGKAAMEMGIPLFVVDPAALSKPSLGNAELIRLGATELTVENDLDHAVNQVLIATRGSRRDPPAQPGGAEQMLLFP